jgi:hypothetical protein
MKKDYRPYSHIDVGGIDKNNHDDVDKHNLESLLNIVEIKKPDYSAFSFKRLKKELSDDAQNKDVAECTLLLKLHNESCNTNLDPEYTIHQNEFSNDGVNLISDVNTCIDMLHQESCMTNLDPYTKAEFSINSSQDTITKECQVNSQSLKFNDHCHSKEHTPELFNSQAGCFDNTESEFSDFLSYELSQPVCSFQIEEKKISNSNKTTSNRFRMEDTDSFWDI